MDDCYGDIPRGVFLIRGENVVLLGEVVCPPPVSSVVPIFRSPAFLDDRILTRRRHSPCGRYHMRRFWWPRRSGTRRRRKRRRRGTRPSLTEDSQSSGTMRETSSRTTPTPPPKYCSSVFIDPLHHEEREKPLGKIWRILACVFIYSIFQSHSPILSVPWKTSAHWPSIFMRPSESRVMRRSPPLLEHCRAATTTKVGG